MNKWGLVIYDSYANFGDCEKATKRSPLDNLTL